MTLPTGAISLNQIHKEAGGSSATSCTINDTDIRNLISKGSAAQMSFSEWRGASVVVVADNVPSVKAYKDYDDFGVVLAQVDFKKNGAATVTAWDNDGSDSNGTWATSDDSNFGSDFEVRFVYSSSKMRSGTPATGAWTRLNTTVSCGLQDYPDYSMGWTVSVNYTIRRYVGKATAGTGNFVLEIESSD